MFLISITKSNLVFHKTPFIPEDPKKVHVIFFEENILSSRELWYYSVSAWRLFFSLPLGVIACVIFNQDCHRNAFVWVCLWERFQNDLIWWNYCPKCGWTVSWPIFLDLEKRKEAQMPASVSVSFCILLLRDFDLLLYWAVAMV